MLVQLNKNIILYMSAFEINSINQDNNGDNSNKYNIYKAFTFRSLTIESN